MHVSDSPFPKWLSLKDYCVPELVLVTDAMICDVLIHLQNRPCHITPDLHRKCLALERKLEDLANRNDKS
jgi:hypothetical protein